MRKPHNLITEYWDDIVYFLEEAERVEATRDQQHPSYNKRSLRYSILSSFLFLEAFINGEYFAQLNITGEIKSLKSIQKKTLETIIHKTPFEDKWSLWVADFMEKQKPNLQNENQFKGIKKLKQWRNQLAHYKLHDLMVVGHEIQNINTAREALSITRDAVEWYYEKTGFKTPDWILRDIINKKTSI